MGSQAHLRLRTKTDLSAAQGRFPGALAVTPHRWTCEAAPDDDKTGHTEPPSAIPLGVLAFSGPRDNNVPPVPPVVPYRDNRAIWATTPGPFPRQSPAGTMGPCVPPEPKDAGRKSIARPRGKTRPWPKGRGVPSKASHWGPSPQTEDLGSPQFE